LYLLHHLLDVESAVAVSLLHPFPRFMQTE
jgi:hypothetical protein